MPTRLSNSSYWRVAVAPRSPVTGRSVLAAIAFSASFMAIFVFQSAVLRAETPTGPQLLLGCPSTALAGAVPAPWGAPPERGRSSPRVGVGGAPASWIMSQGAPGHRSLNPCRTGTRLPSVAISRLPRRCRTHTPCPTHRLAKSPSHSTPAPCRTRAENSSKGRLSWRSTAGLTSWKKAVAHLDPRDRQTRRARSCPSRRRQALAGLN